MIRKLSWCCPKISFELLLARIDAQRKYFQPSIAAVKLILWKLPLNEFAQNDIFQQKNISFAARWNRRTFTCCSPRTRLKSIARSSHSSTATAAEQSPQLSSARSCGRSDGTRQREICRFGLYLSPKVSNCVTRFSKNSPLWQNFKRLWYCLEGLLSVGNIFDPTLATKCMPLGKVSLLWMAKLENIIYPSGHIGTKGPFRLFAISCKYSMEKCVLKSKMSNYEQCTLAICHMLQQICNKVYRGASIAQRIHLHLPSCHHGFKSKALHQCFHQFIKLCT